MQETKQNEKANQKFSLNKKTISNLSTTKMKRWFGGTLFSETKCGPTESIFIFSMIMLHQALTTLLSTL